jgi:hypothetical protein
MSSQLPLKADIAQYGRHFAFVPTRDSCTAAKRLNSITPFLRKKEGSINLSGFDFPTTLSFRLSSTLSEQKKQTDAQRDFNFQCNRNGRNDLLLRPILSLYERMERQFRKLARVSGTEIALHRWRFPPTKSRPKAALQFNPDDSGSRRHQCWL